MKKYIKDSVITANDLDNDGYDYIFDKQRKPVYKNDSDYLWLEEINDGEFKVLEYYPYTGKSFTKVPIGDNDPIYSSGVRIHIGGIARRYKTRSNKTSKQRQ